MENSDTFIVIMLCLVILLLLHLLYNKEFREHSILYKEQFESEPNNKKETLGFIILRHINNEKTNKYWEHSYECIRKFYPENLILIIDDNSNYQYVSNRELYKTTIIKSEFPKRGELLPYYYYLNNKLFDTAVIIHDSVFINKYIDFNVDNYKMIWDIPHNRDQIEDETRMIKLFNDDELLSFYKNKSLWNGCFGGMTIIKHDFLTTVNKKYNLNILLDAITSRYNRCSFERVIGCILSKTYKNESLLGSIHDYCPWGVTFEEKDSYKHLPIIKVWTGR